MRSKGFKRILAGIAAFAIAFPAAAVSPAAASEPMLVISMTDEQHDIVHGAAGFLYGVSSEGVPTTSLLTPLKPKVLATKGALGTEHPYGDALDVAKTFLESGGKQVQMYNSNYYAIFGPTCTSASYADVLATIIAPAVVKWKAQWKQDHHADPVTGIDDLGLDIDKAIVYLPINEGTPNSGQGSGDAGFNNSWKLFYQAIKGADPKASIGGPNDALYGGWRSGGMRGFLTFCNTNNCWPDVITWHQLDNSDSRFAAYPTEFADYKQICADLGHEQTQVVINEYAAMVDCGVPGRLINFFANFEENQVYACLPFWHQADNLNDIAASANEPNGAWWLYQWYGDMSGKTLPVQRLNTPLTGLNAVSTLDDNKRISTTLFGGVDGNSTIVLKDLDKTQTFLGAAKVNVKIDATYFKSFNGAVEPETAMEGTYALQDGNLEIDMKNMKFSDAYRLTVTPAKAGDQPGSPLIAPYHAVYEAENAATAGSGMSTQSDGKYYLSNGQGVVGFSTTDGIDYNISVPAAGRYKIEFVYGNELGTNRGNEALHSPQNQTQTLSVDGGSAISMVMINTMERGWTGIHTEYLDLQAGAHKLAIRGTGSTSTNLLHDMLHVTFAGAYGQPLPAYDKVFQAEQADFNTLASTSQTQVTTRTDLPGYTGSGYVTGLNKIPVAAGGGIRWTVVVQDSGLYNLTLRYQSAVAGSIGIHLGNTARTFDGFTKTVDAVDTANLWDSAKATVYLEKGVNIVDIDATADIALDSMRVKKAGGADQLSQTVLAKDAIPAGAQLTGVPYLVWDCKNVGTVSAPVPQLFTTTMTADKTAVTKLSPNGTNLQYVVGRSLTGSPDAAGDVNKYLEFKVTAAAAGTYAMQVFESNDEIFGTHSYNTKIIDKFACFQVNGKPAGRYFFINSISRDTFKEKTVMLQLDAGENTIKVYNDDSWGVLKGLENSANAYGAGYPARGFANDYYMDKPGNIPLVNSLPNLYKFVITPAALAAPLADTTVEHQVNIRTTAGGTAVADKNVVADGGSVTFTLRPEAGIVSAMVNGAAAQPVDIGGGAYQVVVSNVVQDVELIVNFVNTAVGENENDPASPIANNSFGTGDTAGWTLAATGAAAVETNVFDRYDGIHYLKLSGASAYTAALSQSAFVPQGGVYRLGFAMKNAGECNSIEFSASVGSVQNLYMPLAPSADYKSVSGLVRIPEGGGTLNFSVKVDGKAGFEAYIDGFTLAATPVVATDLAYFVDCGDHNPATINPGDSFGMYNSVTDKVFGPDPVTGKKWGVYDYLDPDGSIGKGAGGTPAVYTQNTWANQNTAADKVDGQPKTTTFRYARGQDGNATIQNQFGECYVDYKFELTPGRTYSVEVCLGNWWGNSSGASVYVNRGDKTKPGTLIQSNVSVPSGGNTIVTGAAQPESDGILTVSVRKVGTSNTTVNVNYIMIRQEASADAALAALRTILAEAEGKNTATWGTVEKGILEKSIAFAQSVLDSGTTDGIIISNANDALSYALTLEPGVNGIHNESELQSALNNGGEYRLSNDFSVINAGTAGTAVAQIYGDGKTLTRGNGKFGDAMLYFNGAGDWSFENMTIDGNKANYTHTDACLWLSAGKVTFKNVTIQNFKGTNTGRYALSNAGCNLTLENVVFQNNEIQGGPYFAADAGINTLWGGGTTTLIGATAVNIYYGGGTIDVSGLTEGCRVMIQCDTDSQYSTIKSLVCNDSNVIKLTNDSQRLVTFGIAPAGVWSMDVSKTVSGSDIGINVLARNGGSAITDARAVVAVYDAAGGLLSQQTQDVSIGGGAQQALVFSFQNLPNAAKVDVSILDKATLQPIVQPVEFVLYSNVLAYTRTPVAGAYSSYISNSVHIAYSADGITYTPLNKNYGILFAQATFSANNNIVAKCAARPYIFRMADGSFGIVAARVDSAGADDADSKGKLLFWHSDDLYNFTEPMLLDLQTSAFVKYVMCAVESGKNTVKWSDENGNYYSNVLTYSGGQAALGAPAAAAAFSLNKVQSNVEGAVDASAIIVDGTFGDNLLKKWKQVENVGVRVPSQVTVSSPAELNSVKAAALYSDGSTHMKTVSWNTGGVNFGVPGTYTVTGTVEQNVYPFPMDRKWGDPIIMLRDNKYYFMATNDSNGNIGFEVRQADSAAGLFASGVQRATILDYVQNKFDSTFWAPEFHEVGGDLYIFFAVTAGSGFSPQSYVMRLKPGGDIMKAGDWEEPIRVVKRDGSQLGTMNNQGGITLDMTYFAAGGVSYVAWSYRTWASGDSGSMIYIATVDPKAPWQLTSDPVLLTRPVYGWENVDQTNNNEGPYPLVVNNKVYLLYSVANAGGDTYALGLLTADLGANLLDRASWVKSQRPVLFSNSVEGEYGPGHNGLFVDEKGDTYITYHAHTVLGNSDRLVGIRRVHFDINGAPLFDMSAGRDLKDAYKTVTMTVNVQPAAPLTLTKTAGVGLQLTASLNALTLPTPQPESLRLLLAFYNAQGRLLKTVSQPVQTTQTTAAITVPDAEIPAGAAYAKGFLWDNMFAPMCDAVNSQL